MRQTQLETHILRIVKTAAYTPVTICTKLGYRRTAKADTILLIVDMAKRGLLQRSWDEEGDCFYQAAK